jgi:hypothetical protein
MAVSEGLKQTPAHVFSLGSRKEKERKGRKGGELIRALGSLALAGPRL